jgi:hypothetical protein
MPNTNTNDSYKKVALWMMGCISSIASYVAVINKSRLEDVKKDIDYLKTQINIRDNMIVKERKEKDSLQAVIVNRTDASYKEIKDLLDIKNKNSTITITPKK